MDTHFHPHTYTLTYNTDMYCPHTSNHHTHTPLAHVTPSPDLTHPCPDSAAAMLMEPTSLLVTLSVANRETHGGREESRVESRGGERESRRRKTEIF